MQHAQRIGVIVVLWVETHPTSGGDHQTLVGGPVAGHRLLDVIQIGRKRCHIGAVGGLERLPRQAPRHLRVVRPFLHGLQGGAS